MTPSSSSRRSRSNQHRGTPSSSSATRSSVTMGSATDNNDSSGTRPQTYVKKPVCFCGIEAVQKTAYTPNNYGKQFYGCPKYKYGENHHCRYFAWCDWWVRQDRAQGGEMAHHQFEKVELESTKAELELCCNRVVEELILDHVVAMEHEATRHRLAMIAQQDKYENLLKKEQVDSDGHRAKYVQLKQKYIKLRNSNRRAIIWLWLFLFFGFVVAYYASSKGKASGSLLMLV